MAKILVSACLLGCRVRYKGNDLKQQNNDFDWLIKDHDIISFCPEVSAGLPTPRVPAEIQQGVGQNVLSGNAKVQGNDGSDLTSEFIIGAQLALEKCRKGGIVFAVLAESSPSCGSNSIYDGNFNGNKKLGKGVTAAILDKHNVKVYSQYQVAQLKIDLQLSLMQYKF